MRRRGYICTCTVRVQCYFEVTLSKCSVFYKIRKMIFHPFDFSRPRESARNSFHVYNEIEVKRDFGALRTGEGERENSNYGKNTFFPSPLLRAAQGNKGNLMS